MQSNENERLEIARRLAEEGDYERASTIAYREIKNNPNSYEWLTVMTYILLATEKAAIAYQLARRVADLAPRQASSWLNLGMAARDLRLDREAIRHGRKALRLSKSDEQRSMICVNISSSLLDMGKFEEGEKYCQQAIELNPDTVKGKANLGFCQLSQRKWKEGWENYRYCLGHEWRPRHQYNDEPEWDGKGTGNIVLYGEQGLGDQISFASIIPDAKKWADKNNSRIILDVSNRLTRLLKRSFPDVKVYGTQGQQDIYWDKEDRKVDHSLPIGQACQYFRNSDEEFSGKPYLKADPDRVKMWKALFKSKKKPVIGIGWSSGIPKTGSKWRKVGLEQLLPVLKSVDAHWVSLQYKPAAKEIADFKKKHPEIDLVEYPHGTLSNDYDDTVAMIAAMDHVIAMHTTANHVSGGLGIPTWVFVPKNSQWRYGCEGENFVWANSVRILRQTTRGKWDDLFDKTGKELNVLYPRVCQATGKATQDRKLRSNRAPVRRNGKQNRRQAGDRPSP